MNRFALIGASYKTAGVDKLGRLALPKADLESRLAEIARATGVAELAYIGTCNRIEFMVADEDAVAVQACRDKIGAALGEGPTETRKIFRAWAGDGAIEHLFLVASGLDSAQAGEREIYAQVRIAWQTARAAGTCGPGYGPPSPRKPSCCSHDRSFQATARTYGPAARMSNSHMLLMWCAMWPVSQWKPTYLGSNSFSTDNRSHTTDPTELAPARVW